MGGKWVLLLVACITLMILVASAYAGGWVVVTVRHLPEYAVAGRPFRLVFMVRGAGVEPTCCLMPKVESSYETSTVSAPSVETKNAGEYMSTLVFPRPGKWTIRIDAFGDGDISRWSGSTLRQLVVIAPGNPAPPALSRPAVGERLFVAKGCEVCHFSHEGLDLQTLPGVLREPGLDLAGNRFPESYLKSFLGTANSTFGHDSEAEAWRLPNLGLTESEISSLTAFINREPTK
jgi:hypothetical protein